MNELIETFLKQSNYIEGEYTEEAYQDAVKAWDFLMAQDVLTPAVICKTHAILMADRPLEEKYKGHFRTIPVYIGRKEAMNWRFVPLKVAEWCKAMYQPGNYDTKSFHIEYEHIHPFVDGNGRTGRMFMNWMRVKKNNEPVLIIWESEKFDYYKWFE